ncbi:MAG: hypothetical protein JJ975_00120 [Bacteroidia bacterium]|nr:hypothetical protein [Bacteroidia bacterium]
MLQIRFAVLYLFLFCSLSGIAQEIDSTFWHLDGDGDSIYRITENPLTKNKFLGNSWYTSLDYVASIPKNYDPGLNLNHQFGAHIGRTLGTSFGGGGGTYFVMRSWGASYSYLPKVRKNFVGGFAELSAFPFPPGSLQLELIRSTDGEETYLRPSLGLSLFVLDISYSYAIPFQSIVRFTHGISVRFKWYPGLSKWQYTRPSRC